VRHHEFFGGPREQGKKDYKSYEKGRASAHGGIIGFGGVKDNRSSYFGCSIRGMPLPAESQDNLEGHNGKGDAYGFRQ
jgi:hypothetical protein